MNAKSGTEQRLATLIEAVRAAEPSALLVAPRILHRVIKFDRRIAGLTLQVPHRDCYAVARETLLEAAQPGELGLADAGELPGSVILLPLPDPEALVPQRRAELLLRYWRWLFHARVHVELARRLPPGAAGEAVVAQRWEQLGPLVADEVRSVLRQENYLTPPLDRRQVYLEFAAVYLELRYFSPELVGDFFPAIEEASQVDRILAAEIDPMALWVATRLAGAEPGHAAETVEPAPSAADEDLAPRLSGRRRPLPAVHRYYLARAERARRLGNMVRAANDHVRAAWAAPPKQRARAMAQARLDLEELVRRLRVALSLDETAARRWRAAILPLLEDSAREHWSAAARLLYDLQKLCVDFERNVFRLDVAAAIWSLGARPLKRPLPIQRLVLMCRHLRSAANRVAALHRASAARDELRCVLAEATAAAETRLRVRLRPLVAGALASVGLRPANLPEEVGRKKLIEELLDVIVDRGFLAMGDLRDAISRNNLKLPDLAGPQELVRGDQLLRVDLLLSRRLDGVYRRGEAYLRWPQRISAVAFGTRTGRFLTRYIVLPFGGAYLALGGLQHVVHMVAGAAHHAPIVATAGGEAVTHPAPLELTHPALVFACGLAALILWHFRGLSLWIVGKLRAAGRALRRMAIELPLRLAQLPPLRWLAESRLFWIVYRWLAKPAAMAALGWALVPALRHDWRLGLPAFAVIFLAFELLLNSRLGQSVDELAADFIVRAWQRFRLRIVAELVRIVMDFFNGLMESVDRLLYAVDEWLRFRSGDTPATTFFKVLFSLPWRVVDYAVRMVANLLIEPQINPIKHFPIVTVSHKILLPLTIPLAGLLEGPLGKAWAGTIAGTTMLLLPGVFGFLAWELKGNWRLYAANRALLLEPLPVGDHGETMVRLLRPGFHSGTLPKLFRRLRRAHRKSEGPRTARAARRYRHELERVEIAVARFYQRDLIELVASVGSNGGGLAVGHVALATNSIRSQIQSGDHDRLGIELAEHGGRLVLRFDEGGWLATAEPQQAAAVLLALCGLCAKCGAEQLIAPKELEQLLASPATAVRRAAAAHLADEPPSPSSTRGSLRALLPSEARAAGLETGSQTLVAGAAAGRRQTSAAGAPSGAWASAPSAPHERPHEARRLAALGADEPLSAADAMGETAQAPLAWTDWVAAWSALECGPSDLRVVPENPS